LFVLLLAGLSVLAFVLSRQRLLLGVVTNAATAEALKVKATYAETLKLQTAAGVIEHLLGGRPPAANLMLEDDGFDDLVSDEPPPRPPLPAASTDGTFVLRCGNCDSQLRLKQAWRGKTITCPSCKHEQVVP
jgi:hypothetical protein